MARPGAGVGGTHEAPSHSGGHAACTHKESRRIREERTLSRVYVTFRGKVIYMLWSCDDHRKGFFFALFLWCDEASQHLHYYLAPV